ncbi:transmembrane protein, putative (macronuclear) [Tetrahymena thermophila SB210]|uniref:Transmembrane protein, putative n=1 Tax=Tetrahymena thermophila (strain SB210) TaxID=312017 RepID=I7MB02_TETTS|nr:transmembrane protein, putative [Tetrahymena thermophila SB210]EAS07037.2 transmembrane protein, putative [Tetrahymena thermophila SB210]|eukprot:XP_001027279.2 transmembrane protein, putative [Tetrahymena thermophila SB210]
MIKPQQKSDLILNNLVLYSQEIFSFHMVNGIPQISKMNYKNLNQFFAKIVLFKTKSLWRGLFLTFLMNVVATVILYATSSKQFILGFYYLPIGFLATVIWGKIKKSQIQLKAQIFINLLSLLIFGSIFFCIYFLIYHPIIQQQFDQASKCTIEYSSQIQIGENKNELYTFLALSFIDKEGISQIGCGCISSKSSSSILSNSPFPYIYLEKNQRISTFSMDSPEYESSEIKLPSWLCAGNISSISLDKIQNIDENSGKIKVNQCFYNNYLGFDKSNNAQQLDKSFCLQQKKFLQVIFSEKPYYDATFLHLVTAIIYEGFWSYGFIWPSIMLSFLISRFLRKIREYRASRQQARVQASQVIPENSISISYGQNKDVSMNDNTKNISYKDQTFIQPSIVNFDNSYLDQYSPQKVLNQKQKIPNQETLKQKQFDSQYQKRLAFN